MGEISGENICNMGNGLPIYIIEPESTKKRELTAKKIAQGGQRVTQITDSVNIDDIKQRLKRIREYSRDNASSLLQEVKNTLVQKYPQTSVKSAYNFTDAVRYITEISHGIKIISTNNSRVVNHELKPALEASDFTVINSYLNEFEVKGEKAIGYWELPFLFDKNLKGTFEVSAKMEGIDQPEASETREYLAVLGVNAVSAEDGTVFFLQHFSNILCDLKQAKKVILVIGIDKIVKNREDAAFQTKCMSIFGMESMVQDIPSQPRGAVPVTELAPVTTDRDRELHIIILDNDRTHLLQSKSTDLFMCIGCLACNIQCPARISGKPLSPRELVLNLKKHLSDVDSSFLKGEETEAISQSSSQETGNGVISKDEIWACTTCRACVEACPVELQHIDTIVGMRQNLVMEQAVIPDTAEVALRSIEARGHPWRGTTLTRTDWNQEIGLKTMAEEGDVEILYWVGCTEALEDRSMQVARAMGKLLKLAGVEVGFLGAEESCCGEPARRLGNEYLFQMQAEKNIELLKSYDVKKIVAPCPHCYHTLKNEYPQFGGDFEVMHHTQFIAKLIEEGRLTIANNSQVIATFHDPCYLSRHNRIYESPRQILHNIPAMILVEMKQNRTRSFCCGGGGGHMWLEEHIGRRMSEMRLERALDIKAEILVTACPYCLQMFEDAVKTKGVEESLKVMDIAELVGKSAVRYS